MSEQIHAVTMPKWGIEMTEGTVIRWNASAGQRIDKGEPLLEVETEKIVNTVDSPFSGTLRRIVAESGEVRPVGALLAVLAENEVSEAALARFIEEFKGAQVSFEPEGTAGTAASAAVHDPVPEAEATDDEPRVSPHAKRLAERLGIDLAQVRGSGRNGRITREDVEAFSAQSSAAAPAAASGADNTAVRLRLSPTRVTIARRLLESKQTIPHYRLSIDVRAAALVQRAAQATREAGRRITVNDLLVRSCALALVRHPELNAWLEGEEMVRFARADVAVAVATANGLITPVVRGADAKSPAEIAAVTAELFERARRGELTREDISGGTFTISNLGMFGLPRFDAIINPPQVAILAVGAAEDRVVALEGVAAVTRIMTLTLSADHRVIDGAVGAAFLGTLRALIEEPQRL
ncbi:MAG: dihydrolipoamide acetyltransferase family protein [Steroidobacteraceae bacterium]